jgi:UDP-glucose 4-epimerase
MHEQDVVNALSLTLDARPRGVFNVAGPHPVPLSVVIRETGRTSIPLPGPLLQAALGRFGLPRLPRGALDHIRYPITVDSSAFKRATKFAHSIDEKGAMSAYRRAFPPSLH